MKRIKAVILESDNHAAKQLREAMEENGQWAVEHLPDADSIEAEQFDPDVLALDITSPAAKNLEEWLAEERTKLIAMAAEASAAQRAFQLNAVDFLRKPLKLQDIERALNRVQLELRKEQDAEIGRAIGASMRDAGSWRAQYLTGWRTHYLKRLVFKWRRRLIFLDLSEVQWFQAEGNYVAIHTAEKKYLIRQTMSELEQRLDPNVFLRIHRRTMVNVAYVQELVISGDDPHVLMTNATTLPLGPLYRTSLNKLASRGSRAN